MSSPEQFRKFADTCVQMAKDVSGSEHEVPLLDMAEAWRRLATEADRFEELVRDVDRAFDPASPQDAEFRPHRRSH